MSNVYNIEIGFALGKIMRKGMFIIVQYKYLQSNNISVVRCEVLNLTKINITINVLNLGAVANV